MLKKKKKKTEHTPFYHFFSAYSNRYFSSLGNIFPQLSKFPKSLNISFQLIQITKPINPILKKLTYISTQTYMKEPK